MLNFINLLISVGGSLVIVFAMLEFSKNTKHDVLRRAIQGSVAFWGVLLLIGINVLINLAYIYKNWGDLYIGISKFKG